MQIQDAGLFSGCPFMLDAWFIKLEMEYRGII